MLSRVGTSSPAHVFVHLASHVLADRALPFNLGPRGVAAENALVTTEGNYTITSSAKFSESLHRPPGDWHATWGINNDNKHLYRRSLGCGG